MLTFTYLSTVLIFWSIFVYKRLYRRNAELYPHFYSCVLIFWTDFTWEIFTTFPQLSSVSVWSKFVCLCWGLMSQSTIFQSCRDGATASWVINQYFQGVKCLAQGHNTAVVGFEPHDLFTRFYMRNALLYPPFYGCVPISLVNTCLKDKCLILPTFLQFSDFGVNICQQDSTWEVHNFSHLSSVEFWYFGQYLFTRFYTRNA